MGQLGVRGHMFPVWPEMAPLPSPSLRMWKNFHVHLCISHGWGLLICDFPTLLFMQSTVMNIYDVLTKVVFSLWFDHWKLDMARHMIHWLGKMKLEPSVLESLLLLRKPWVWVFKVDMEKKLPFCQVIFPKISWLGVERWVSIWWECIQKEKCDSWKKKFTLVWTWTFHMRQLGWQATCHPWPVDLESWNHTGVISNHHFCSLIYSIVRDSRALLYETNQRYYSHSGHAKLAC